MSEMKVFPESLRRFSVEELNYHYERLSSDLMLVIKGSGPVKWKREVSNRLRVRINLVVAEIQSR
jgi:hypothetical protein